MDNSEHFQKAAEAVILQIKAVEQQLIEKKKLVNQLFGMMGRPAMYTDLTITPAANAGGFRNDSFYGQPLAKVVRMVLEARQSAGQGAASVAAIYQVMVDHGYKFESVDPENSKRALRISLTKNSAMFHKLPNGNYGLREWYPNIRDPKVKATASEPAKESVEEEFDFEGKEKELEKEEVGS